MKQQANQYWRTRPATTPRTTSPSTNSAHEAALVSDVVVTNTRSLRAHSHVPTSIAKAPDPEAEVGREGEEAAEDVE